MKGSVGTATHMVVLKDKVKKRKHKKGYLVCTRCKKVIKKGEWITASHNLAYRHYYRCPKGEQ